MNAQRLKQRKGPQLVSAVESEFEVGWRVADRIAPGEYPAYSRSAKIYFDPLFQRWVYAVQFDVLDESLTKKLARLVWFVNLAVNDKPYAGRRTHYWHAWLKASGKTPSRSDRLSSQVFTKRYARVFVRDTTKDYHQHAITGPTAYSVVGYVVSWQTGETM